MAFKKALPEQRKLQLVSLIDLIFILLIFFIISSILIRLSEGEARLYLPTPKNEPGEAQILIQILDRDNYIWLDHTAIDTLYHYSATSKKALATQSKMAVLIDKMRVTRAGLIERIEQLKQEGRLNPARDYFVLVRCPHDKPYYYATDIIEDFADLPNFEYGCVAGTVRDLAQSDDVYIEGNVIEIAFK